MKITKTCWCMDEYLQYNKETVQQTITSDNMLFSRHCCKKCLQISKRLSVAINWKTDNTMAIGKRKND